MKKGLAVFSGTSAIHKLLQDGTVVLGNADSGSVVQVSGTLSVTGQVTLASAQNLVVGSAHAYSPETNLSGILAAIKADVVSAGGDVSSLRSQISSSILGGATSLSGAVNTRFNNLEGIVEAAISGGAGTGSAWFSGINSTLDSIREIAEFLDGTGSAAVDLTQRVSDVSSSFNNYKLANDAVINAASFTVNGTAISASSGSFTIVTGSSNNLTIVTTDTEVKVDLDSTIDLTAINLTGKLSASSVEASGEVKGVTVVSTGKMTAGDALEVTTGGLQIVAGGAQITGSVALKNGLNVSGSTTLQGAATLQSSLTVNGVAQLNGALTASAGASVASGLTVSSGDLLVSAGKLSASAGLEIGGNATVVGTTTLTGKLTANGGIDIDGNLSGSGTLQIGGAVTLASTLSVAGVSTLAAVTASSLEVNGAADVDSLTVSYGNLSVSAGNASISGTLAVTGSATFNNGVSVATGSAAVEHGTLKAVMVSGVDDLASLYAASGSSNGKFFYLQGTAAGGFPRGDCWYFCQNSDWFDAPFFGPEA